MCVTLHDLHTRGRYMRMVTVIRNGQPENVAELYMLDGKWYVHEFDSGLVKHICDY
jgi:hypothetical protein